MSSFDPDTCQKGIAPQLSNAEKLEYIQEEREFVEDLVEDAADSKWVYQALIGCALTEEKLTSGLSVEMQKNVRTWLEKLRELDPLRNGRWTDLQRTILHENV